MSPLLIGAFVLVLVLLVAYFAYNQGKRQSKAHPKSLPTRNNATPVRQTTPRQTSANRPATSALQQRIPGRVDELPVRQSFARHGPDLQRRSSGCGGGFKKSL